MRILATTILAAGAAAMGGCATTPDTMASAAPRGVCVNQSIDTNNDGMISAAEWNAWRASSFAGWDADGDRRITEGEFRACYMAGGFYPVANYNPSHWNYYWTAFDANRDGYLTADEYFSAQAWANIDRNRNAMIDDNEWGWWSM